ncbi:MAG: hypothetical protein GF334_01645 [Candidatus Altiarchaeales archaeon]|nr:hypothetical protein [Candidatus Altiarchaeales archaeon]
MSEEGTSGEKISLSFQEVESLLDSVLNNQRLQQIDLPDGSPRFVVFCFPTGPELLAARYTRDKTLAEAAAEGLPTIEEMDRQIQERGLLEDVDQSIKDLEERLEGQRAILNKTQIPGRRSAVEEVISKIQSDLYGLRSKKESYYYLTQERKADEVSYRYLAWASTYSIEGGKYWKTFDDFENETDIYFQTEVLGHFAKFNSGLPAKKVRYLARHNLWRIRFVAATKTGAGPSLFCRRFNDLTPDQLGLLYWSNYYQSIYEMLPDDQPDQEIIEDDEKLDKYMEDYFKQKEAERKEGKAEKRSDVSGHPKGYKPKLNAWERGEELIITPSHPEYQSLAYTEKRINAPEGTSEVEVISPNSRRARNRRAQARSQSSMRGRKR